MLQPVMLKKLKLNSSMTAFAIIANHIIPGAQLDPAAFAIVGMAAVFAAASRATFAFIVFAFEITREYQSVLPLMLVCVIASGIAQIYLKESIMTERLSRRGLKIHLEYEVDPLREVSVASVKIGRASCRERV